MQDKARRKIFQILQESLLKEEQEKYEKAKKEFAKWNDVDLREISYIQQKYIQKININWWSISDLKYHIDEVEEAKKEVSKDFIKVYVREDMQGHDTEDNEYIEVFTWHWIMGYELLPESIIKSKAKAAFISAVSQEAHERYIEINPEDKGRWKIQVSCFLIEAFLNWEIEFDFLVRATYKGCSTLG